MAAAAWRHVASDVASLPLTMRAVSATQFGGPEVLCVRDNVALPDAPAEDSSVLVKICAAGVNPVETYMRAGVYARLPTLPWTPGNDGAGIVVAAGNDARARSLLGKRVWLSGSLTGTYAQYCACSADCVHPLADSLSFEQGASVGIAYKTAYRALFHRARVTAGQLVFVHGASGGVGLAAIQLAVLNGLYVVGSAGTSLGQEAVRGAGAHHVVNHRQEGYMQTVKNIAVNEYRKSGVDAIIEMLANKNLGHDLKILNSGGVVAVVGNRGDAQVNARDLMMSEGSIVGVLRGSEADMKNATLAVERLVESGAVNPVVGQTYSLDSAGEAHHEVIAHEKGTQGKIVISNIN